VYQQWSTRWMPFGVGFEGQVSRIICQVFPATL
jgi:hypothetical protein